MREAAALSRRAEKTEMKDDRPIDVEDGEDGEGGDLPG